MISKHCALVRQDGQIAVLNAGGVFFCIREHDRQGRRTALGMLSTHHLASVTELAAAFDVSRGTVYRCKEAYRAGGVDALKATREARSPSRVGCARSPCTKRRGTRSGGERRHPGRAGYRGPWALVQHRAHLGGRGERGRAALVRP